MTPRMFLITWQCIGLCGMLGLCGRPARAIDLTAAGSWARTITAADLQAGAGSDLTPTYTSGAAQVSLAITGTTDAADTWRIDVRRTDDTWPGDFTLSVRRTGDGSGPGTISSGGAYQAITLTDATFFSGAGDRTGITLQLQVTGLSVSVAPAAYATTITYTVVDVL